ncbi:MAG: acyl-CoA thioesterase [Candidatus Omnitrophica bacterium]|nr:acyl-CoA thioesterase [Candidatus Omnitrophota bacterium]
MFTYNTQIFLHHTDAAGRLFFANQFYLIYEAKEKFFDAMGLVIIDMLNHPVLTFPLVHAESDYKAMLAAGDKISISVGIEKLGATSVTFAYTIMKGDVLAGTAKTVSVCVDKKTQTKCPLPAEWRQKFQAHLI